MVTVDLTPFGDLAHFKQYAGVGQGRYAAMRTSAKVPAIRRGSLPRSLVLGAGSDVGFDELLMAPVSELRLRRPRSREAPWRRCRVAVARGRLRRARGPAGALHSGTAGQHGVLG